MSLKHQYSEMLQLVGVRTVTEERGGERIGRDRQHKPPCVLRAQVREHVCQFLSELMLSSIATV
jgi:hypothetical protein